MKHVAILFILALGVCMTMGFSPSKTSEKEVVERPGYATYDSLGITKSVKIESLADPEDLVVGTEFNIVNNLGEVTRTGLITQEMKNKLIVNYEKLKSSEGGPCTQLCLDGHLMCCYVYRIPMYCVDYYWLCDTP